MLSYFDLSYIEFFGIKDIKVFSETEHPEHSLMSTIVDDQFNEGFSRFVVRTDDIESAAKHFQDKGLSVNGPYYRSRKTLDGSLLEWHLLYVGNESDELELPYIIQWYEGDKERRKSLIEKKVIGHHPSGAEFSHISMAVWDLNKTVEKWSSLLNLPKGEEFFDEELQAQCRTLKLLGGDLVFASPIGEGVLLNFLRTRGEKPFLVNLTGSFEHSVVTFKFSGGLYRIKKEDKIRNFSVFKFK